MDLIEETISAVEPTSEDWRARARSRIAQLTMPPRALGRLLELAEQVVAIRRTLRPGLADKLIIVMAADHGVAQEGVSAFPQEVTGQMVRNFVAGGAGINVLARTVGARVVVVDMGVNSDLSDLVQEGKILGRAVGPGTRNLARGPAMTGEQARQSLRTGIEIVRREHERGLDLLGIGDMGIANTTPASAIAAALTRSDPEVVVGRGTGIDDDTLTRKVSVVRRALEVNRPDPDDPVDVLSKVGGFEIGGIAGMVLGAVSLRIPVLVDGFISAAGALVAARLCPLACQYLIGSHNSVEPGHQVLMQALELRPLLDLGFRLGEGTGAAVAMHLVESSVRVLTEMATFGDAGVSGKCG